jgi:3-oxoacyl-[acyl-carrier protein] reductase
MPNSATDLRGKVAVITGASRGIGLEIARLLAAEGCNLALTARTAEQLKQAADSITRKNISILAEAADVANESEVSRFFGSVGRQFGRVDFLINNAGVAHTLAPVEKLSPELWRRTIDINLTGTFLCTHFGLPLMHAGGTIINNLSVAAKGSFPGHAGYNAAKAGALGLTKTLREELRDRRIRVVALIPGPTDTDIWQQFWPDRPRDRMMSAASVAEAVVACLKLPPETVIEEITLRPIGGTL